jgi:hypothetical protein
MERADLGASALVRAGVGDWDPPSPKSKVQSPKSSGTGPDTNHPHPGPLPTAKRTGEGEWDGTSVLRSRARSKRCLFARRLGCSPTGRDKLFHRENPGEIPPSTPVLSGSTGRGRLGRDRNAPHPQPLSRGGARGEVLRTGRDTLFHRENPAKSPVIPTRKTGRHWSLSHTGSRGEKDPRRAGTSCPAGSA